MPNFKYETIVAHYTDGGAGDPVFLLHAGGSSGRQWRKITGHLEADFRLIAPDSIGFGETGHWPGTKDLTHDVQAQLIRALVERVSDAPIDVVGHSYGGSTAIRLALAAPEKVRRLVLIEPIVTVLLPQAGENDLFAEYRALAEGFIAHAVAGKEEEAWRTFLDLRNGAGTWAGLPEKARAGFLSTTGQALHHWRSNLNNPTTLEEVRGITQPTMVIRGAATTMPERRVCEILRSQIPGCDYEIIPGAEHMSPLTHPAEVASVIRRHLASP